MVMDLFSRRIVGWSLHEWTMHDLGHIRQIAELVRARKHLQAAGKLGDSYRLKPWGRRRCHSHHLSIEDLLRLAWGYAMLQRADMMKKNANVPLVGLRKGLGETRMQIRLKHLPVSAQLIATVRSISRERAERLGKIRAALEAHDDAQALRLMRAYVGLAENKAPKSDCKNAG